jgi:RNA polymerase sigma-70 factor (ECF subfamily)
VSSLRPGPGTAQSAPQAVKPRGSANPTDVALIDRCLANDPAAWEEIVLRFRRKVFHIAYKFTGKHDAAEDLTQEIFLKVFKSLDKFHRDADFSTWLSSVARHYCIDNYRANKRERELLVDDLIAFDRAPASSGNPQRTMEERDTRSLVRRGLDQLPPKLREAVVLRDLQGLSYQEMAERLKLPERDREEPDQPRPRGASAQAQEDAAGRAPRHTRRTEVMLMQLKIETQGDVTLVRVLEAKLTYPILAGFFSEVRQSIEGGSRKLLIDLQAVSYIDSASIGCLMDIHRLLQERAGTLRLSGLQPRVETMLSMTGVHKIIAIHREEQDALDEWKREGKADA